MQDPLPLGTKAKVISSNAEFSGIVMRCVPVESGYLIGMRGEWRLPAAPKDSGVRPIWDLSGRRRLPAAQRPAEKVRAARLKNQHKRFSDPTVRMQFMLETAAHISEGQIELEGWRTAEQFQDCKVRVPEMKPHREKGDKDYIWRELEKTNPFSLAPNAVFTLRFPHRPEGRQVFHFCYEADPGLRPLSEVLQRLRAYYHLIERQRAHAEMFGVDPIDAVLVETNGEQRARRLMEMVESTALSGSGEKATIFQFTISPLFTVVVDAGSDQKLSACLVRPEMILEPLWAAPDFTMHALGGYWQEDVSTSEATASSGPE